MSAEDISLVTQMLAGILNPNNTIRKEAEAKLQMMYENISALLFCLVKVLKEGKDIKICSLSAVLLRKITELHNNNWKVLSDDVKTSIKNELLLVLIQEKDKYVKFKICDAIAKISENIYENDETWNELLQFLFSVFSANYEDKDAIQIESALQLLTSMFGYVIEDVMKNINVLLASFKNYFKTNNMNLRAKTALTISEMISICDKKETKLFREFIIMILETTMKCIGDVKEESNLKNCLSSILNICEAEPNLLRKSFSDLYILMSSIMDKKDFADESIRELGYEIIISLTERIPKLLEKDQIKLKDFLERLFKYSLEMDTEISNDWCVPKTESYFEEEFIPEECVSTTLSLVVRLIECLGKKFFLPYVSEVIMQLIQNENDWRYKYVAFMTIAQIVEFIPDIKHIENLMPIIFSNVCNTNPKISYSAIYCIDLFSDGFHPHFQDKYNENVVSSLIVCLKESVLRNQLEACEALETFLEHCSDDVSGKYAQYILDNIFQVFLNKDCAISLREQILSVVSELINSCDEKFKPFSENCLKILLEFFSAIYSNKTCRLLYGTLIECITLIGPFCKDLYLKYVPDLIKSTTEIHENLTNSENFTKDYLQNAWERLAPIVKENFKELIPCIVEAALKQVNLDVVMSFSNKPEQTFKIEDIIENLEQNDNADKQKSNFNTAGLEDKSLAIESLNELIEEFGGFYLNYVEQTQKIIIPLLLYKANCKIRSAAANTLPLLLTSVRASGNNDLIHNITKVYISELLLAAEKEIENSTLSLMLDCIGKMFEESKDRFLNTAEINQLFDKILFIFSLTEIRRRDLITKQEKLEKLEEDDAKEKLYDSDSSDECEDYADELDQDIDEIEEILESIADLMGKLFKTHKELTLEVVDKLTKVVIPGYLKKDSSMFEIKMGLFIVDDLIEHLGQEFLSNIWNDLAGILVNYSNDENAEIRQASVYGMGIFAIATKTGYEKYSQIFLEKIDNAINSKSEDDDENQLGHAKDNAISALGKHIVHQGNNIKDLQIWIARWIEYLPLSFDDEEGIIHHEMFCNALIASPDMFLGQNYCYLFNIIRIFTTIFKTKFTNSLVDELIIKIIKKLVSDNQITSIIEKGVSLISDNLRSKFKEIIA